MIRRARIEDLDEIMTIIEEAKRFIRSYNSPQWQDGSPSSEQIKKDIENDSCYVCEEDSIILGTMSLFDYEVTYDKVHDGTGFLSKSYLVIHRIATKSDLTRRGIASKLIEYANSAAITLEKEALRIDTHEKNIPMIRMLNKLGFTYVGVIHLNKPVDFLRNAYERMISTHERNESPNKG